MASIVRAFRSFFLMAIVVFAVGLLATGSAAENHLLSGEKLKTGENISDINYSLEMQVDCNLVLYELNPKKPVWYTHTNDKGTKCELTLTTDGNLVIEDENGKLVWESKTSGTSGNYILLLQRDRNVVIYSNRLWTSTKNV
ncbi:mannose-specific lectin-like [Phalaenopsis equestris]|uniref:mannose-specific lectin-like n=1 Tax=Phalaenopsis equestris TaxID=78828 RepID=UPI0009E2F655|nr:mannose-specific lectin-like [Phalaenopsis equestris]